MLSPSSASFSFSLQVPLLAIVPSCRAIHFPTLLFVELNSSFFRTSNQAFLSYFLRVVPLDKIPPSDRRQNGTPTSTPTSTKGSSKSQPPQTSQFMLPTQFQRRKDKVRQLDCPLQNPNQHYWPDIRRVWFPCWRCSSPLQALLCPRHDKDQGSDPRTEESTKR